jgi:hypothetical protein
VGSGGYRNTSARLRAEMDRAASAAGKATGKKVVIVFHQALAGIEYGPKGIWTTTARGAVDHPSNSTYSKDETVAATQAWIAAQADPSIYEMLVIG